MSIITFTRVAGAECRYAREPVAPYGTVGKVPRKQRLGQEAHAALEAAIRELGELHPWGPPAYIVSAGAMVPQSKRRGPTDPHVRGVAYDIDSLWWDAAVRIDNPDGHRIVERKLVTLDAPQNWPHYIAIQCILARHFGTVLGHDYNRGHRDHWHCDVTRPVRFDVGSRMDVLLLQRGLREVWGADIAVDGKLGPQTLAAWQGLPEDWRDWLLDTARMGLEGLEDG